jgi:predicted nuclease of predicted toxin-antitoxin system
MILADENIDARIISFLRASKIKIYSIIENNPGISDEEVILLAKENNQIILTEDKDFGE